MKLQHQNSLKFISGKGTLLKHCKIAVKVCNGEGRSSYAHCAESGSDCSFFSASYGRSLCDTEERRLLLIHLRTVTPNKSWAGSRSAVRETRSLFCFCLHLSPMEMAGAVQVECKNGLPLRKGVLVFGFAIGLY